MSSKLPTTKIVYYYQHVNQYGRTEKNVRVEVPGLGVTITEAFEEWKAFMSAVGYAGMEKYELMENNDNDT